MTSPETFEPWQKCRILDALPDAIVVVERTGTIVYLNTQGERIFGFSRDEVIGEPVELLMTEELRALHKKYVAAYASHPRVRPMGPGVDLHGRRKDGSRFPAEISLAPVAWEGAALYCATVRDVSTSRSQERILRAFRDVTPDALLVVDGQGRIVSVNPRVQEFFGYAPIELIGQPIEILVPERFTRTHAQLRSTFAAHPRARPIGGADGLVARRKDGSEFPADISLAPVETGDGLLVSVAIRDVSERVAMQRAAERTQQEFFATVSHELRTPLTSILGYVELMSDLEELSPQGRKFLKVIGRNAKREQRLVNDMLALVSLHDTGLSIRFSQIDLGPVVSNAVEAARPQADVLDINLRVALPDGPVHVSADAERVGQAIDNLLSNALKFTPRGGRVQVTLGVRDGRAQVDVADTGSGIQATDARRIFDRAYRSGSAVAQQVPGVGLGLTIARAIAEDHEGWLTLLESSARGSTFRLDLPVASAQRRATTDGAGAAQDHSAPIDRARSRSASASQSSGHRSCGGRRP